VSDHLGLHFDLVELLSGVHTNDGSDHLWDDNHVSQMSLNKIWFLVWLGLGLCLPEFFDEAERTTLQASVEPTAGAGVHDVAELFRGEFEESVFPISSASHAFAIPHKWDWECDRDVLVELDTTVRKLAEGSLLLQLCRNCSLAMFCVISCSPQQQGYELLSKQVPAHFTLCFLFNLVYRGC
jgi:hypothetical protein